MITFSMTVFGFVMSILWAIAAILIVFPFIASWRDWDCYDNEFVEFWMRLIGACMAIILFIVTLCYGFEIEEYFAEFYDIDAMIEELESEGIEVKYSSWTRDQETLIYNHNNFSSKTKWVHYDSSKEKTNNEWDKYKRRE